MDRNYDGNPVECRQFFVEEYTTGDQKLSEEFHTYALEWKDEELVWYFEDHPYQRIPFDEIKAEFSPFTGPFYIILNLAVGGDFLPNPDELTKFPQAFIVDYVRVFQK